MENILEGSLERFEVPDLLTFLDLGRRTGVLVLERPQQETKLFLRGGKPVFATSTREDLRLGSTLVRLGKVKAEDLDRVLQQQSGGRIGQLLLSSKLLGEEELATFLKVQVSEVIFDTFGWHDGTFVFFDKVPPPVTAVTLEMNLQNLVMEGVRRLDERARLADVFPDLNMVVEALANPERVKQSVNLTQEEWQVFFLVDGRRSLSEICRLAGNPDELATLQILHNLVQAKFVAVVGPLPEQPASENATRLPAPMEPMGTQRYGGEPAPEKVSVEFSPAVLQRRLEDDTKEVVNPRAIQYLASVSRVVVSRLTLLAASGETSFPLNRDSHTLGRHRNNDIVITDPKVSSFHARIDRTGEGFTITDLKSRNGIFINGRRVESARLKGGEEIRVGTARLIYKVDYTSSAS
ncbi:MAG TPA: DUF4388 domain-containing protein [Vicinamibacteria bacterium]|nr:DUF4388 domain-containing protein [Vicinamibacteria bacterium]